MAKRGRNARETLCGNARSFRERVSLVANRVAFHEFGNDHVTTHLLACILANSCINGPRARSLEVRLL